MAFQFAFEQDLGDVEKCKTSNDIIHETIKNVYCILLTPRQNVLLYNGKSRVWKKWQSVLDKRFVRMAKGKLSCKLKDIANENVRKEYDWVGSSEVIK